MKNTTRQKSFGAKSEPGRMAHLRGLETPSTLLEAIAKQLTHTPENTLKWLIEFGAVYVNHRREISPERMVMTSDQLRVHLDPRRYPVKVDDIVKCIVWENDDFIIFDKPTGLPMHPTLDNLRENLVGVFDHPLYVTNRLDVPTSGIILVAKTKEFQAAFNQLLTDRRVQKSYQALTLKAVPVGELKHLMKVTERAPKELVRQLPDGAYLTGTPVDALNFQKMDKYDPCVLKVLSSTPADFKTRHVSAPGYENRIELVTGRTHQIRAQLSFEGAPIVGDEMYGGMAWDQFGLHSEFLAFTCPLTNKPFEFKKTKNWNQ